MASLRDLLSRQQFEALDALVGCRPAEQPDAAEPRARGAVPQRRTTRKSKQPSRAEHQLAKIHAALAELKREVVDLDRRSASAPAVYIVRCKNELTLRSSRLRAAVDGLVDAPAIRARTVADLRHRISQLDAAIIAVQARGTSGSRPRAYGAQAPAHPLPATTFGPDDANYYQDPTNSR